MTQTNDKKMVVIHYRQERQPITFSRIEENPHKAASEIGFFSILCSTKRMRYQKSAKLPLSIFLSATVIPTYSGSK